MFFLLLLHEKEAPKASHKLNLGLYVLLFLKAVAVFKRFVFPLSRNWQEWASFLDTHLCEFRLTIAWRVCVRV